MSDAVILQEPLCGPNCLFGRRRFVAMMPRHSGAGGMLFRTAQDTLVKRKKHRSIGRVWGASIRVDLSSKRAAFAAIRQYRPKGVLVPLDECDCAYEGPFISGSVPRPATGSVHETVNDAPLEGERARRFLCEAGVLLDGLHRLGIRHGDPSYTNFLITEAGIFLIDLDDVDLGSSAWAWWERRAFFRDTAIPLLGRRVARRQFLRHCLDRENLYALALGAPSHFFRRGLRAAYTLPKIGLVYLRRVWRKVADARPTLK